MSSHTSGNLARAREYLAAIEAGATGQRLAAYYTPDVLQEEFPNQLVPNGAARDLPALLEGAERGQQLLSAQRYEIYNAFESGDTVVLEVGWTGVLAVPVGTLAAGSEMHARFAVFIEFREGKIARQRNYDCYDPW